MNPPTDIPLSTALRLSVPLGLAAVVIGIAFSPILPAWRMSAIVMVPMIGVALWHHYLKRRVVMIWESGRGDIRVRLAGGGEADVSEVILGVTRPGCTTASLRLADGRWAPLLVDGRTIQPGTHWEIRRLLLAHRAGAPDGPG